MGRPYSKLLWFSYNTNDKILRIERINRQSRIAEENRLKERAKKSLAILKEPVQNYERLCEFTTAWSRQIRDVERQARRISCSDSSKDATMYATKFRFKTHGKLGKT